MIKQTPASGNAVGGSCLVQAEGTLPGQLWLCVFAIALATVVACWVALPRSNGAGTDTDELLQRLAKLSRDGAAVLCDPTSLEKKLHILIDDLSPERSDADVLSAVVRSTGIIGNETSGTYSEFRAASRNFCRLRMHFANHRFCDSDSARVQRLLGERVRPGMPMLGEAGFYDHGYAFTPARLGKSVMGWRQPARLCPAEIEIVTERN